MFYRVHNYLVGNPISIGSFSTVRIGVEKESQDVVAVKVLSKTQFREQPRRQKLVEGEITLSQLLVHPNIVRIRDIIESETLLFIVMDFMENDLTDEVERPHSLSWKLKICDDVLSAIEYLHARSICHRDIKLDNIMIDGNGNARLIDFGFADFANENVHGTLGSPGYVPPEVINNCESGYDGMKADMWSFGCTMYMLFKGELPLIGNVDYSGIPKQIATIIKNLLNPDPEKRPSAGEVRKSRVFSNISERSFHPLPEVSAPLDYAICSRVAEMMSESLPDAIQMIKAPGKERIMYILLSEMWNNESPCTLSDEHHTLKLKYAPPQLREFLISRKFCISRVVKGPSIAVFNAPDRDVRFSYSILSGESESTIVCEGDPEGIALLESQIPLCNQ